MPQTERPAPPSGLTGRERIEAVNTLQQFAQELHLLRAQAGSSVRAVAERTKHDPVPVPRETVGKTMRGQRLAPKPVIMALLRAWNVPPQDLPAWETAWSRVYYAEGGLRELPRPSELTALREMVERLCERLDEQERQLAACRAALADGRDRPGDRDDLAAGRTGASLEAGLRSLRLEWDLRDQMQAAIRPVAHQTVSELARTLASKQLGLPFALQEELAAQMRPAAAEVLRERAAELLRKHPSLELDLRQAMQMAVAQVGRDAIAQLARRIS